MAAVNQEALAEVPSEGVLSEDNPLRALVVLVAAILLALPVLVVARSARPQRPVLVAVFLTLTNLKPVVKPAGFLGDNQAQLRRVDCLEQHLKAQLPALAAQVPVLVRRQALQILSVAAKHKTSLPSLAAPAEGLEAAQRAVASSVVPARHLEQTNPHKARILLVALARRISRASKVKIKTNQEASLEVAALVQRRRRNHSRLAVCSAEHNLQLVVAGCSAAVHLGKARQGSEVPARVLAEVSLVDLARNPRSQLCLVGLVVLEARRIRALADCLVEVARPHNKVVAFLEELQPTILVASSAIPSSHQSKVFSEPVSLIQLRRTTVSLVGSRPTAFSTHPNKANRHPNSLKDSILLS